MKRIFLAIFALSMVAGAAAAKDVKPLVDVPWLKANLEKKGLVVLSVRLRTSRAAYEKRHIPGSIFTHYGKDGWRVKTEAGVAGMLPPVAHLEKLIGSFGIGNSSHVVLVPTGANSIDMGTATRVYWTLKVLGHDKVSILDGGWRAWSAIDKNTQKPVNAVATGSVKPKPQVFKARLRNEMLVSDAEVKKAVSGKVALVDNRPSDFFLGIRKSPAATVAGTIPGSKNIEQGWITKNGKGKFRSRAQLEKIYKAVGVPVKGDQINFCNTGHWASLGWFASSEILGNKKARMYDGSMSAWTRRKDYPVQQAIR